MSYSLISACLASCVVCTPALLPVRLSAHQPLDCSGPGLLAVCAPGCHSVGSGHLPGFLSIMSHSAGHRCKALCLGQSALLSGISCDKATGSALLSYLSRFLFLVCCCQWLSMQLL